MLRLLHVSQPPSLSKRGDPVNRTALLSSLALCVAAIAVLHTVYVTHLAQSLQVPGELMSLESELEQTRDVLTTLESKLDQLGSQFLNVGGTTAVSAVAAELPPAAVPVATSTISPKLDEIAGHIETLVARVDELSAQAAAIPMPLPSPSGRASETPEARAQIVADGQTVAEDRSLTPQERLGALRALRFRDGRSHEVTLAMIELIEDPSLTPPLRADIVRQLDEVTFEELKAPLLHIIASDPDVETRSEAVETLQPFYDDPAVYDAVVHVRDHDTSHEVRREAMRRLQQFDEWSTR